MAQVGSWRTRALQLTHSKGFSKAIRCLRYVTRFLTYGLSPWTEGMRAVLRLHVVRDRCLEGVEFLHCDERLNVKRGAVVALRCKQEVLQAQRAERHFSFTPLTLNQENEGRHLFQSLPETRKGGGCMNYLNHLRLSQIKRARPYVVKEDNVSSVPAFLAHDLVRGSQQGIMVKHSFLRLRNYLLFSGKTRKALTGFLCHLKYIM
jgi:hypothetical protein